MGEYSYCDELIKEYKVEELDSMTLKYRIDGFVYACGMDLSDSFCFKEISPARIPYINKHKNDGEIKYNINFIRSYDRQKGKNFVLLGKYCDLNLYFVNYFNDDKRKNRINEIPFNLSIGKVYDNIPFKLDITSILKKQTRFVISRNYENSGISDIVSFDANITSFSIVLRLIKLFIKDPDIAYIVCKDITNQNKKITSEDLSEILERDEKLDKPVYGVQKIMKKILNNN